MNTKIIVDFEATCCDKNSIPRHQMEIIEIGACATDNSHNIISEFQAFIRPVRHTVLTEFCTSLTAISQLQVNTAKEFPNICRQFKKWIWLHENPIFCSWGAYDKNQLLQDCEYHKMQFPFGGNYTNLKTEYADVIKSKRSFGLGQALRNSGISFEGTPHRGIDDAKNIARLLPIIYKYPA